MHKLKEKLDNLQLPKEQMSNLPLVNHMRACLHSPNQQLSQVLSWTVLMFLFVDPMKDWQQMRPDSQTMASQGWPI